MPVANHIHYTSGTRVTAFLWSKNHARVRSTLATPANQPSSFFTGGSGMNISGWNLFQDGTDIPVNWVPHAPNTRFSIFTPDGVTYLVQDKQTGLIWPRNANFLNTVHNWLDTNTICRDLAICNRKGWRVPTVEELSSLIDTRSQNPSLPAGHPFISVQTTTWSYWTCTNHENPTASAWFVNFADGGVGLCTKSADGYLWPVYGGFSGVSWNW